MRDESTCKSRDAVRYSSTLACVDERLTETVATSDREIHTFRKGNWTKCIPSIGKPPLLYKSMNLYPFRCDLRIVFPYLVWIGAFSMPTGNTYLSVTVPGWIVVRRAFSQVKKLKIWEVP